MKTRFLHFLALPLFLAACAVGPDYRRPDAPVSAAFKEARPADADAVPWAVAKPDDAAARGKWWEIYRDPGLNALEEQVALSNQNILAAEAQYREARAVVRQTKAGLYPSVNLSPSVTTTSASTTVGGTGAPRHLQTVYDLPVEASYMVDIWGQVRRQAEQSVAQAQASEAALENARLSYQAELAVDWFSLRGIDAERELFLRTVGSYEKYLTLTKNRYAGGIASQGDVAQAQSQLDTARVSLADLELQRAQYEHAIAVLVGKAPAALSIPESPLAADPPAVPAGVPAVLLQRRPDIAEAERNMAAANAAIGVAVAGYYPQITIDGSMGFTSTILEKLLTWPSLAWSIGPTLVEPIFNAGKTRAQVAGARAGYEAAVAQYRQAVLAALQQVEDDLAGLRLLEREEASQVDGVIAADKALEISLNGYKAGTQSSLDVIINQTAALTAERSAIDIRIRRITTSVLLVEALGGGWTEADLPTSGQASKLPKEPAPEAK